DSVIAMERLNEALERIDSSFQFALLGQTEKAEAQYAKNWKDYDENLEVEQENITLPGEMELVEGLTALSERYRAQGDAFYARGGAGPKQREAYFRPGGLLALFDETKKASGDILRLNQNNMEQASREARQLARDSVVWFAVALAAAVALALVAAQYTVRNILQPIRAMTEAALGVSAGRLDQLV